MADQSLYDVDTPRRPRRGPPPRLYVIARQSPVPWLRVRRLGEADRPALLAHLRRLAEAASRDGGFGEDAATPSVYAPRLLSDIVVFGTIAGNLIVAAACAVPGPDGMVTGATEEAEYRDRGLGAMLVSQVLGALPAGIGVASTALAPAGLLHRALAPDARPEQQPLIA